MAELLRRSCDAAQVDAGDVLYGIRLIKDEDELVKILRGYELVLDRPAGGRAGRRPAGITEIELFTAALGAAQNANGGPIEFLCDLLSGPKTADVCCPIHIASPRAVQDGEAVIADVALGAQGYWGDSAETHTSGRNEEVSEMRAALLAILAKGVRRAGHRQHRRGHLRRHQASHPGHLPGRRVPPPRRPLALALSSFEDPHLIPSEETPLESWMVMAIEPGVYFPGRVGARVENVYVVTPDGGVELRDAMAAR